MKLYHVTSRKNRKAIESQGILPSKAVNKERAVWMVSAGNVAWALAHTAAKPGRGSVSSLIVYEIDIPRKAVRRYRRGIWRTFQTVKVAKGSAIPSSCWTENYPS